MIASIGSGFLTALVLLLGMVVQGGNDLAYQCVRDGCKAAYSGPLWDGCAGGGLVTLTWVNVPDTQIAHGNCHCPEGTCVVQSNGNTCSIAGMKIKVTATNPAHSLEVWGVNYGASYTWSPKAISGCNTMKTEAVTLVGVSPICVFAINIQCRPCSFDC